VTMKPGGEPATASQANVTAVTPAMPGYCPMLVTTRCFVWMVIAGTDQAVLHGSVTLPENAS